MSHISPVIWQFLVHWMTTFALFPPEASKIAPQMDALYFFMVLVSLIGLTIVILLVTSFSILYRRERHPVATQIEGSTLLEATWTIIPLGLFLVMFVWGALIYFRVYTPPNYDEDPGKRFPVLYLFHGTGDTEATWTEFGRAHFILDNLFAEHSLRSRHT